MTFPDDLVIRFATAADTASVLGFIRDLAEYEKLSHEVVADETQLRATLFGVRVLRSLAVWQDVGAPLTPTHGYACGRYCTYSSCMR